MSVKRDRRSLVSRPGHAADTSGPTPLLPCAPAPVASPEAPVPAGACKRPPPHTLVNPERSLQPVPDGRPSAAACSGGGVGPAHARCAPFYAANLTFTSAFRHRAGALLLAQKH